MDQKQGRCRPCKIRVVWEGKPLLRDALCPRCKAPLDRTSSDLRSVQTVDEHPFAVVRDE
jgi:hypothetical protein